MTDKNVRIEVLMGTADRTADEHMASHREHHTCYVRRSNYTPSCMECRVRSILPYIRDDRNSVDTVAGNLQSHILPDAPLYKETHIDVGNAAYGRNGA